MIADGDLHRHAAENLAQSDALIFGRVTYEIMEAGWRPLARTGVRPDWMPDWMEPFARAIDAAKKYVVSSTLDRVGLAGHGPTLFAGLSKHIDLKLMRRLEFGSGAVAMRYEPRTRAAAPGGDFLCAERSRLTRGSASVLWPSVLLSAMQRYGCKREKSGSP